jgi:hypothetical protein
MRSLTCLSENRISGLEKFLSAVENDFFNSIGHSRRTKPSTGFVRCPLCTKTRRVGRHLGVSALCQYLLVGGA